MRKFKVKHKDKEREVLIVGTEEEMKDEGHMDYLEEAYKEKTENQLKNEPDKPKSRFSKKEIGQALKERLEFNKRKEDGVKKYY